jgi:hypothetical protein
VSINTRVRATSETFINDVEVQHRRHQSCLIREVASQLYVPTLLTPASSHQLCFHIVCCGEKISTLTNYPVVSLLGTRVDGTSAEVVTKRNELELFATTRPESDLSAITGIWAPMDMGKNVCQRQEDQASSLR